MSKVERHLAGALLTTLVVLSVSCDSGSGDSGEDRLLSVRIDGANRTSILYVPTAYDPDIGAPLVLAFHGSPGNGPGMRISTGLDELADSKGWLIAYPNGSGGDWAAGCSCSNSDFAGIDDLTFIQKLISRINDEYPIDASRVYAVGFSMGGIMSLRLACDIGDQFAGIASVGSSMTRKQIDTCEPHRGVPVFLMVGDADATFPWVGSGSADGSPVAQDTTFSFWARQNECTSPAAVDYLAAGDDGLDVRRERYNGCALGSEVTRLVVEGLGHAWPTTANASVLAFFERHSLGGN